MKQGDSLMLRKARLFSDISESALAKLEEEASVQVLHAGSMLFEQGERPQHAQIVLHGRIALIGSMEDAEMVIEFFTGGDVLLAAAVILDLPYLVGARAIEESRVALVPAASFRALIQNERRLAVAMTEEMARHWRTLIRQIKDLKLRTASQRLAAYLLSNAPAGKATMRMAFEKQALASRLGMTPESLSRAFRDLRQYGVLATGTDIRLGDVSQLKEFCQFDEIF